MPNQEARMAAQRRPLTLTLTLTLTEETNAQARCLLVATTALHTSCAFEVCHDGVRGCA